MMSWWEEITIQLARTDNAVDNMWTLICGF